MSRKFYLENQNGDRIPLNGERDIWLYDVTGIGVDTANDFADISRGFYAETKAGIPQQTVDGTLLFKGPCRLQNYAETVNFILNAAELRLVFIPVSTEYYRKVKLKFLSRGESTRVHLETSLSLSVLSPWYLPTPLGLSFAAPKAASSFRWNVSRWGQDRLAASTAGTFSALVTVEGHIPAAIKICFSGSIENPVFRLRGVASDTIYGQCRLSGKYIGELVLNTEYSHSYVENNGLDLLDDADINYEPFFRIPVNEECSVEVDSPDFAGTCTAEIYQYFRSV